VTVTVAKVDKQGIKKTLGHSIPLSCISQTINMRRQSLKLVGNINDQQYIRFVTKMIPQTFKLVPSMRFFFCTLGTLPSVCHVGDPDIVRSERSKTRQSTEEIHECMQY